jgi:fucose 4-O-acetylase-like acetyltransferase
MHRRLAYLDNIKVLLVVGVIALHAAITYGFSGAWYLESYDELPDALLTPLTVVLAIGALFGLGLFFLIAGALTGPSLDRHGPGPFARERLLRLGLPIVAYTLLVSPFMEYADHRVNEDGRQALLPFLSEQVRGFAPGPTWFLQALLLFSLAYAAIVALRPGPLRQPPQQPGGLGGRLVIAVVVAIAVTSFAAHLVFPLGTQQFHVQLGAFPQYVILFSLGVAAGRRGWLETLDPRLVRRCAIAAVVAALVVPLALLVGGFFESDAAEDRFMGGWHWQAAGLSATEGVLSTCVSLWAVDRFRRRHDVLTPLTRRMAPAAYGAFLLHPPVLVVLALAIGVLPLPATVQFAVVLVGGVAGSFWLAALAGRVRPLARLVGSAPPRSAAVVRR